MRYPPGYDLVLALDFVLYFLFALAVSRLVLIAAGRYGSRWSAIVGAHAVTVTISLVAILRIYLTLNVALSRAIGAGYFVVLTNGSVIDTQFTLMVADIALLWWQRRNKSTPFSSRDYLSWSALAAAGLAFLVGYGLALNNTAGELMPEARRVRAIAMIERQLQSDPDARTLAAVVKRDFPDEYGIFLNVELAELLRDDADAAKFADTLSRSRDLLQKSVGGYMRAHAADIAAAPDQNLYAVAQGLARTMAVLGSEPGFCPYLLGKPVDLNDPFLKTPASRDMYATLLNIELAELAAIKAGNDHPVLRDTSVLTPEVRAALRQAARASLDPSLWALANPNQRANATASDRCRFVVGYYEAIAKLPPGEAAQVVAYSAAHVDAPDAVQLFSRPTISL